MKERILSLLITLCMLAGMFTAMPISASAADISVELNIDESTAYVYVENTLSVAEPQIRVLTEDETKEIYSATGECYDGLYRFEVVFPNDTPSGNYIICIDEDGTESRTELYYTTPENAQNATEQLNSASSVEEIMGILDNVLQTYGLTYGYFRNVDTENFAELILNEKK